MEPNTSNKPYLNLKLLGEYVSRERTSDTISSVSILGKRVVRQYASEFILPDDTQVAVSRHESIQQPDGEEEVTLCLSIGFPKSTLHLTNTQARVEKQANDSGAVSSMSGACSEELDTGSFLDTDPEHDAAKKTDDHAKGTFTTQKPRKKGDRDRTLHTYTHSPNGLRIEDYMYDDPWAASILTTDSSTNADLLRHLETGCRLVPELYRMERIQRRRNRETIVNLHRDPTVRSIGLSRAQSETDSIATACTDVEENEEEGNLPNVSA